MNSPSFLIGGQQRTSCFYYPSVYQWIKDFDVAKFIITDSFHGVVFSILFEKPFIVVGNKKRGLNRFFSLLSLFNLENRLIDENSMYVDLIRLDLMDSSLIKEKLKVNIDKVNSFLKSVAL